MSPHFDNGVMQPAPMAPDGEVPALVTKNGNMKGPMNGGPVNGTANGRKSQPDGLHSAFERFAQSIPLNQEYAYTPRKLRIITIGAGFSGLLMAHKFQHRFPELQDIVEHTLFEARPDIGGTWYACLCANPACSSTDTHSGL